VPYHIYTTPAYIIGERETGETGKFYTFFTRNFGVLSARAISVRKGTSKLKYALIPYEPLIVSFIRTKSSWQVIDVVFDSEYKKKNFSVMAINARINTLLKRFLGYEEPYEQLYDDISDAFLFLMSEPLSEKELKLMEILLVYIVLSHLGYIPHDSLQEHVAGLHMWNKKALAFIEHNKKAYVETINASIYAAQL
jgi:recombinational DNA repair protein (RecF pathway)